MDFKDDKMLREKRKFLVYLILISLISLSYSSTQTIVGLTTPPILRSPADGSYTNDNTPTAEWFSSPGATNYNIQISLVGTFSSILAEDFTAATTYTPSSPLPDNQYYWRVRAYDGVWSSWSSIFDFTIDTVPPSAPTLNSPSNYLWINDNTPDFDWGYNPGEVNYNIRIDNNPDMSSPYLDTEVATSFLQIVSPMPDDWYYWEVRAQDAAGNWGDWSTQYRFQLDTVPPDAATLISPDDGYITTTQLTLECSSAAGASIYVFEIDDASDFVNVWVHTGTSSRTYDTNNLPDGTWYWRVETVDNANNVAYSATRTFTIDSTGPAAPMLKSPSNGEYLTDDTPLLEWYNPASAVGYWIQVDTDSGFTTAIVDTTTSNNYYTTPALSDDTYYWRVRAKDALDNWGAWSSTRSFIVDTTAPAAPVLANPVDGLVYNDNTPYLDWMEVGEPANYQVQVDTSDSFASPFIDVTGIADTFYQIVSTLGDDEYYWRVRANDSAGNLGSWSAIRSFIIDTIGPDSPALVSPTDTEIIIDTTPLIIWNTIVDAVEYQLQIDQAGTFISFEYNLTTVNTYYSIITELTDGTYYWRVRAKDNAENWGSWSEIWSFSLDLVGPDPPDLITPADDAIIDDNTPFLNWTLVGDAVEYELELATEITFGAALLYSTTTPNNYYTIFFALSDDVYYWRVRAKDASDNWGDWSIISTFTVNTFVIPELNTISPILLTLTVAALVVLILINKRRK